MPANRPTRDQVLRELTRRLADCMQPVAINDTTDAVMALLAETQPVVLWEGETRATWHGSVRSYVDTPVLHAPPGTRVAVVAVEPADSTQEAERG